MPSLEYLPLEKMKDNSNVIYISTFYVEHKTKKKNGVPNLAYDVENHLFSIKEFLESRERKYLNH